MSNENAQRLHDKLTRGEGLSEQENAELQRWYAQLDQQESSLLGRGRPSSEVTELEAQVATAVAQLQSVTQRIQTLTTENATVRQEIADLQRQLAQKSATQTA